MASRDPSAGRIRRCRATLEGSPAGAGGFLRWSDLSSPPRRRGSRHPPCCWRRRLEYRERSQQDRRRCPSVFAMHQPAGWLLAVALALATRPAPSRNGLADFDTPASSGRAESHRDYWPRYRKREPTVAEWSVAATLSTPLAFAARPTSCPCSTPRCSQETRSQPLPEPPPP